MNKIKKIWLWAAILAGVATARGENAISLPDLEVENGTASVTLPIMLTNDAEIRDFQLDLSLPEGVTVAFNSRKKLDVTTTDRTAYYTVSSHDNGNGSYRFVGVNLDGDIIEGNSGAILNCKLALDEEMASGEYIISVSNARLSLADASEILPANCSCKLTVKGAEIVEPPVDPPVDNYSFYIDTPSIREGRLNMVPVNALNDKGIVAFQCDIVLGEGMSLAKDEWGDVAFELGSRARKTHVMASSESDNVTRVIVYSMKNEAFDGNDGDIFVMPLQYNGDAKECSLSITNILVTIEDRTELKLPDMHATFEVKPNYIMGDANGDDNISTADIVAMVDYILTGRTEGFNKDAADINGDGAVSANDIVALVDMILNAVRPGMPEKAPLKEAASGTFAVEPLAGDPGQIVDMSVDMNNGDIKVLAFQCDITFPQGVKVAEDEWGDLSFALTSRAADHTLSASLVPETENTYRLIAFSMKNRPFRGTEGALFECQLQLLGEPGTYEYTIDNILVTDDSRIETQWPDFVGSIEILGAEVEKKEQEIVWTQEFDDVHEGAEIVLEATATSGLAVSYEITEGTEFVTLEGNVLTVLSLGRVEITATQEGDDEYLPAEPVAKAFDVLSSLAGVERDASIAVDGNNLVVVGGEAAIEVWDATGRLVYAGGNRVVALASGCYIVRLNGQMMKVGI